MKNVPPSFPHHRDASGASVQWGAVHHYPVCFSSAAICHSAATPPSVAPFIGVRSTTPAILPFRTLRVQETPARACLQQK